MSIKQKADEAEKKSVRKLIATKLIDGIDKLSSRGSSKRRWIWELLQNAKDVANGQVRAEVLLTKDYVEFRHNGNPFSIDNLISLINQVSSKERATAPNEIPKASGKFGTGFMTTHLLSRQVEVSGILQNEDDDAITYKRFKVLLDRSPTNLDEMIQKVDAASSIFAKIDNDALSPNLRNYRPNQNCDTSFRYVLDDAGFQVAQTGIQDLHNAIAYTLTFIPTIDSVTVTDETQGLRYSYKTVNRYQIGKISVVKIERNNADSSVGMQTIAYLSNENQTISIAIEVQPLGDELYSIKEIANEIPTLFCEFPLIGSENFPYPVVINTSLFNPTEPRDGIFLSPENEQNTSLNKTLLEKATLLYDNLLKQIPSDWQNVHLLGKLKSTAKLSENMDINWYKENICHPIAKKLTLAQLVDTVSGKRICLKDALIPSYKSKSDVQKFAELASSLYAERLPKLNHVLDWHEILKSDFGKEFTSEIKYTLNQLLTDIGDQKTLEQLATRLSKTDLDNLDWINQVILFTSRNNEDFLSSYNVIPNQYNQFKAKKELYHDQAIPEPLKDVLKFLDLDWRKTLVHKGVTYKLSNVIDISKAVDEIDKIIRANEHPSLRQAVYTVVSCFPTDASFTENTKLNFKRSTIWKLARNLDHTVPNHINIESWINKLWKEADLWLMQTLVDDIEKLENVQSLSKQLKVSPENAISFINDLLALLKQEEQAKIYNKKNIFPNQEGIFKKEEELYIDKNIPEELKEVLEDLGRGCRGELLDLGIRGFENNRNQFTVEKVSEIIKKRLQETKNKENSTEYWSFGVPIYNLVSYFRNTEPNNSKKLVIWEFASDFYSGEIPPKKYLSNLQNFSWEACNEWILNSIAKDINQLEKLANFIEYFKKNKNENTAIEWLDNFSDSLARLDEKILNLYAILPNQSGSFRLKKDLKKDGGIPEELKDILELLTSNYWNDFLLDKSLQKISLLFKDEETKTIEDIATEIDKAIKEWERTDKTGDAKFTKVITAMIEWSNKQKNEDIKELFSHFHTHKAQLFLKTLDDSEVSSGIFTILNHRHKLPVLTNLAENSEIQDLQYLAQNWEQFKEFKEFREQISAQEFQDFNILKQEISVQQITELVENKEKVEILKLLQNAAEAGEISNLIFALQELGIYEAIAGIFSRDSMNNEVSDEHGIIISCQHIADIGRRGEEFLYQKLVEKFGEARVNWLNKNGESGSAYDFVVRGNSSQEDLYIDAKTTSTQESDADRIPFYVGSSEWSFSATNECYYLGRVFRIQAATPTVKFLKFVRLLDSQQ